MQLNNLVGAKSSYVLEVGLKKLRIAGKDVANLRVTSHVTISRDIATKCFPAMPSPFINKDAVVVEIDDERETAVLLYKHDAYWYIVNGTVELIEQPKVETGPVGFSLKFKIENAELVRAAHRDLRISNDTVDAHNSLVLEAADLILYLDNLPKGTQFCDMGLTFCGVEE